MSTLLILVMVWAGLAGLLVGTWLGYCLGRAYSLAVARDHRWDSHRESQTPPGSPNA